MRIKSVQMDFGQRSLVVHFDTKDSVSEACDLLLRHAIKQDEESMDDRLLNLLRANRLIDAIKLYRELTGSYLKESKDYVCALRDRNNL